MTTSPDSPEKKRSTRDFYQISCEIRFLSEAIPDWVRGSGSPSEDAAYGVELILSDIAEQAYLLENQNK